MKILLVMMTLVLFVSCHGDGTYTPSVDTDEVGASMRGAVTAFESVADIGTAFMPFAANDVGAKGGVATTYCGANGQPLDGGGDMAYSHAGYPAARAFCLMSYNSQSPDTPAGSLNLTAGIACTVGQLGLFGSSEQSTTTDISFIGNSCWGNTAQQTAMDTDVGGPLTGVTITVTPVSTDYDYHLSFQIPGDPATMNIYIKSSGGIIAAMMQEIDGSDKMPWAFKLDVASGVLTYETVNTRDTRWMRIRIEGTLGSSYAFTNITSAQGFWMQGGGAQYSGLITFDGDVSNGIKANYVENGGAGDSANGKCFKPGGGQDCTGFNPAAVLDSEGIDLYNGMATAATNLFALTDTLVNIPSVDHTDLDITQ